MSNLLTGDFEAVVEISVPQINGLLGTLHQNGAFEDASLKLLHSINLRLGDPRRRRPGEVTDFGNWVREFSLVQSSGGVDGARKQLAAAAPPGVADAVANEFSQLGQWSNATIPPATVRGLARAQLSSPTLSLPAGSTNEVTVHIIVRAHYYPDAGAADLPRPIHGEIQVTFEAKRTGNQLLIQATTQDSGIRFSAAAGSGLSGSEVDLITAEVRAAVRASFELFPVDLPTAFPFSALKAVGTASTQALALPIQLSSASLPVGNIQSIATLFTGPAGFAFAVSKAYILRVFKPTTDSLLQFKQDFKVSILFLNPTYHFSVTGVELQFNDTSIDLVVTGKAVSSSFYAPNYNNIVIKQRVTLVLFLDTLFIPALDAELTVSGLPDSATNSVKNAVIAQRNLALPAAQAALNAQLTAARTQLNHALRSFDAGATASFRAGSSEDNNARVSGAVAVTPDGVIVRGDIGGTARLAPVVDIAETDERHAFSALKSWVPGGQIDRFIWSWIEYPAQLPTVWSGIEKTFIDSDRFIFPKPPGVTALSNICLRFEGSQIQANGQVVSIGAGTTCHVPDFGGVMAVPSWWEPVTIPFWFPGSTGSAVVNDLIAGHINVQADASQKNDPAHNTLIYFADWSAEKPLASLVRAVAAMARKSFSLVVIVVLPAGTFHSTRRLLEAKLESIGEKFSGQLLFTEDNEGGWSRTFAVAQFPSFYLINPRREVVWKQSGEPGLQIVAAALDEHLVPAAAPQGRALRLAVAVGERAPDAIFEDNRTGRSALHRLRGRNVLLVFWQPWSAPCLKELHRLQQLYTEKGGTPPVIVAFHGGKDPKAIEQIRQEYELTFPVVHDRDQRIARLYGVRCWPTTISINAQGLIDRVQFGFSPPRAASAVPREREAG